MKIESYLGSEIVNEASRMALTERSVNIFNRCDWTLWKI